MFRAAGYKGRKNNHRGVRWPRTAWRVQMAEGPQYTGPSAGRRSLQSTTRVIGVGDMGQWPPEGRHARGMSALVSRYTRRALASEPSVNAPL